MASTTLAGLKSLNSRGRQMLDERFYAGVKGRVKFK
jgi:hypothetical protein